MSSKTEPDTLLDADVEGFCTWLRQNRGIAKGTIRNHSRQLSVLLPSLGNDPGQYSAALVRDALLCNFAKVSRSQAIAQAQTMRMYLRFLVSREACPASLIGAVPTAAGWRLSTLPRYVPLADIERVIASCDTTRPSGIRDRAILLLLAQLALRAGDVSDLRMDDIDWPRARLRVPCPRHPCDRPQSPRLVLDGRLSARCRARSAFATARSARVIARSSRALAPSVRRRRRQARSRVASGHTSQASAAAPARTKAPLLPCSTPYQAPAATAGRVAACRSHRAWVTTFVPRDVSMTAGSVAQGRLGWSRSVGDGRQGEASVGKRRITAV